MWKSLFYIWSAQSQWKFHREAIEKDEKQDGTRSRGRQRTLSSCESGHGLRICDVWCTVVPTTELAKIPITVPRVCKKQKDPTFSILLIWTLLHFLPTLQLSIFTPLQTHNGTTSTSPSRSIHPRHICLSSGGGRLLPISHWMMEAPQPPWSLPGPHSAAPLPSWHARHHSIWTFITLPSANRWVQPSSAGRFKFILAVLQKPLIIYDFTGTVRIRMC